jgi:DNA-directed RNA polymerase subunit RPC12/RpoP
MHMRPPFPRLRTVTGRRIDWYTTYKKKTITVQNQRRRAAAAATGSKRQQGLPTHVCSACGQDAAVMLTYDRNIQSHMYSNCLHCGHLQYEASLTLRPFRE